MNEEKILGLLFTLQEDVTEIKDKLKELPTRSEMNEKLDKALYETNRLEGERIVAVHTLENHETRITKLETRTISTTA